MLASQLRVPVIGFWRASVSIAATGFVCPMAISAARSVDAGRVADFRQSYKEKQRPGRTIFIEGWRS